jgi:hypothetical protein
LAEGNADLAVIYHWSNGTVAPKYFYRCAITIRATGESHISLDLGTPGTAHRSLTLEFTPDAKRRDELWSFIRNRRLDSPVVPANATPGPARRALPGAGECELAVLAQGDRVRVPCEQEEAGALRTMIRALVPPSIEAQIDAAKADFVAGIPPPPSATAP